MPHKFTSQIISAAIAGFEQQKIEIDQQINELRAMLSGGSVEIATKATPGMRKKFSAATKRKMAEAQEIQRRRTTEDGLGAESKMGQDQGRSGTASASHSTEGKTETLGGCKSNPRCESEKGQSRQSCEGERGGSNEEDCTSTEAEA